ncbi:hypothetical protein V6N13_020604 [Hibiscus sabdariffa]|uniref:Uncharacterized protein n=1 Tax=Hibiscus sabdariffa TaxID=183260 RepID=A0ABR2EWT9_9ROSI
MSFASSGNTRFEPGSSSCSRRCTPVADDFLDSLACNSTPHVFNESIVQALGEHLPEEPLSISSLSSNNGVCAPQHELVVSLVGGLAVLLGGFAPTDQPQAEAISPTPHPCCRELKSPPEASSTTESAPTQTPFQQPQISGTS